MPEQEVREAWVSIAPDSGPQSPAPGRYSFGFRPAMGRLLEAHDRIGPAFSALFSEIMRGAGHLSRRERETVAAVASAAQDCYY